MVGGRTPRTRRPLGNSHSGVEARRRKFQRQRPQSRVQYLGNRQIAQPFVIRGHNVPRRMRRAAELQHVGKGSLVLAPLPALGQILRIKLPLLSRVVQAHFEAATLFGFADLIPMRAHVPFAWVMGYDLYPVETVEAKKKLVPQAARENWTCLFYHEPDQALGAIVEQDGKFRVIDRLEDTV